MSIIRDISEHWPEQVASACRCPCCGSPAKLNEEENRFGHQMKFFCCSNQDPLKEIDGEGVYCPMYLPPMELYQPTVHEALTAWTEFSAAINERRKANGLAL